MSVYLLERAAEALGSIADDVVFLGAATLPLWITDPGARELRPTLDVDVVVEVTTRAAYNRFEDRLRDAGFRDEGSIIGRFKFGKEDNLLDAIPADASILGFDSYWQQASIAEAQVVSLPSGVDIRALSPSRLLATKLEAFAGRGGGDYLGSSDFEDIVGLIDGRAELSREVTESNAKLRRYVARELSRHLGDPKGKAAIAAHLEMGRDGRIRAAQAVIPRINEMLAAAPAA